MKINLYYCYTCFFISLYLLILNGCTDISNKSNNETSGTPVEISNPQKISIAEYKHYVGYTEYLEKEIIRSSFSGYIVRIYKSIGDNVKKGDLLFQIKTKESYFNDSLNIGTGNKYFDGKINIKAVCNGVISEINFKEGDLIVEAEQLGVILNPSSLAIRLNIPFEDTREIKLNYRCIIKISENEKIEGVIIKNLPLVNRELQTQQYLIKTVKNITLPSDLGVEIYIPIKKISNIIVVPKQAVMSNEDLTLFWIMVLKDDSLATKIFIKKGTENDTIVEIKEPKLNLNDRIVSNGAFGLDDTAKIKIITKNRK